MTPRRDPTDHVDRLRTLLDADSFFSPINSVRRRTIVRYLARLEPTATTTSRELAWLCAAVEGDQPIEEVSDASFRRLLQGLRQRDLTRLSLADVVERTTNDTISRGSSFERYATILRTIDAVQVNRLNQSSPR
ncbi:hypothetical protein [Halocatena halophila]|uniref:hypothetical protein n=1 Tax=Halocatena halophila TaxID=2814576 RepID=UPI002ED5A41A